MHATRVKTKRGSVVFDARARFVGLSGEISQETATAVGKFFNSVHRLTDDWEKPVKVFINSYGGDSVASFHVYQIIKSSFLPVETIGMCRIFRSRMKLSMEEVKGMLYENKIFTAEEAKKYNLADEIINGSAGKIKLSGI